MLFSFEEAVKQDYFQYLEPEIIFRGGKSKNRRSARGYREITDQA
jgi:hypothetical protein